MRRVLQDSFPARVESLSPARTWAIEVLARTGAADVLCTQAVLVLSELASETLGRLNTDLVDEAARVRVYVSTDVGAIGLGVVCESHLLRPPPAIEPLRSFRRQVLEAFAAEHGTQADDVVHTRWAELRWNPPHVDFLGQLLTAARPEPGNLLIHPAFRLPNSGPRLN